MLGENVASASPRNGAKVPRGEVAGSFIGGTMRGHCDGASRAGQGSARWPQASLLW